MEKIFDGDYKDCCLVNVVDGQFHKINPLEEIEVENLIKANQKLYEFVHYDRRMKEINYNYDDLLKTIFSYERKISGEVQFGMDATTGDDIYVNINRVLTSFITSMCVFVDHIEEKKYSNDEKRKIRFKQITSTVYDTHFSYRLFYNLRNFALHYDFPINMIKVDKEAENKEQPILSSLKIFFDKNQLLSDSQFKQKMETHLLGYNNIFPINFAIQEILIPIKILFDGFLSIEKKGFQEAANVIMTYANRTPDPFKAHIAKMGENLPINTLFLPVDYIQRLTARILAMDESILPR